MMRRSQSLPSRQKGVTLFIALISLVAMTLAAIALMRSVDTGNQIAGNLAFKQGATNLGDAGVEAARTWLVSNASNAVLNNDSPANGYYATSQDALNMLGSMSVDWSGQSTAGYADNAKVPTIANLPSGYTVAYVINRLCVASGSVSGAQCVSFGSGSSSGSSMGGGSYGAKPLTGNSQVYYRVTVRVAGPRNTVSFVESVVLV